jgi:hypothetical protein
VLMIPGNNAVKFPAEELFIHSRTFLRTCREVKFYFGPLCLHRCHTMSNLCEAVVDFILCGEQNIQFLKQLHLLMLFNWVMACCTFSLHLKKHCVYV